MPLPPLCEHLVERGLECQQLGIGCKVGAALTERPGQEFQYLRGLIPIFGQTLQHLGDKLGSPGVRRDGTERSCGSGHYAVAAMAGTALSKRRRDSVDMIFMGSPPDGIIPPRCPPSHDGQQVGITSLRLP